MPDWGKEVPCWKERIKRVRQVLAKSESESSLHAGTQLPHYLDGASAAMHMRMYQSTDCWHKVSEQQPEEWYRLEQVRTMSVAVLDAYTDLGEQKYSLVRFLLEI